MWHKDTITLPNKNKVITFTVTNIYKIYKMKLKVGVLKETKNPPDRRVAITPNTALYLKKQFPEIQIVIQSSNIRAFSDDEYQKIGIPVVNDISDCDILFGVKEVSIPTFITNKTYVFFSHTAKKQRHNQKLLKEAAILGITLKDHEYFTDKNNMRLVAFGKWAGIVGAYNALIAYGLKTNTFSLKRAHECFDMKEMLEQLKTVSVPPVKILITGGGRVAHGALETLSAINPKIVSPEDFINKTYNEPVVCRLDPEHYACRKDGKNYSFEDFITNPQEYTSTFKPFTQVADIYIPCHFWDPKSPNFINKEDYLDSKFNISVIADVSCDMDGPIASTLKASTIANPFYGYNPKTGQECGAWDEGAITVTSIDNLPGELPRDSSEDFSMALAKHVLNAISQNDPDGIIERATILKNGKLTAKYSYLQGFLDGNE